MDISKLKSGERIEYVGDSFAYGGDYLVVEAESTYKNPADCPEEEKGKLMIIEFMNDGTPMYFTLEDLNPKDWKIKNKEEKNGR